MLPDLPQEFYDRLWIGLIMFWGFSLKVLYLAYREDQRNGPDCPFTFSMIWHNANKWRIMGSLLMLVGLAGTAPNQGFKALAQYVIYDGIPMGHLGVALVGLIGDDLFLSIGLVADRLSQLIKSKEKK